MHTLSAETEPISPLLERERTLNKRKRNNKRVPFSQKDERPEQPRVHHTSVDDISNFRFFIKLIQIYDPMDDADNEPMWANDRIVAPTPGPAITIPETANEFAIKGNHLTLVKGNQIDGR